MMIASVASRKLPDVKITVAVVAVRAARNGVEVTGAQG